MIHILQTIDNKNKIEDKSWEQNPGLPLYLDNKSGWKADPKRGEAVRDSHTQNQTTSAHTLFRLWEEVGEDVWLILGIQQDEG